MRQLVLNHVLAATDFTPGSGDAVRAAAALARLAGARLHVVHAAAPGEPDAEAKLREHLAGLSPGAAEDAAVLAPAGAPDQVILQAAARVEADVIVLGPHRDRGGGGAPLGSTADRVVRGAEAPCLIVPRALHLPLGRVVAALDPSDSGRGALMVALTWASALRRPSASRREGEPRTCVDAFHVVDGDADGSPRQPAPLAEYVAAVRGAEGGVAGVEIEEVVRGGGGTPAAVARAVVRHVAERGADLLVVGTRNLAPAGAPALGSVSSAVIRDAAVPVLLVPPAVWRRAAGEPLLPS